MNTTCLQAFFGLACSSNSYQQHKMKLLRLLFLPVLFFFSNNSFGQLEITNSKTENHIHQKGTQVFLQPPNGFETAANFLGFQNQLTGSSIMVIQMTGPYEEVIKGFTPENMKTKGMTLLGREAVKINQQEGQLLWVKQFSPTHGYDFQKYTLVLKLGPKSTLIINGNFPELQKEAMAESIRKCVLSAFIEKSLPVNPFASVDFTIDLSNSVFKPSTKTMSGGLLLEGPNNEMMIVVKSIRAITTPDKKGASINVLKTINTITYVDLVDSKEIIQDGATGYQITANVLERGEKKKAIQAVLFGENYYYVFLVILPAQNKPLVSDFERILASFKRK
ncbi:MAG TPA: hypothetical protein VMR70_03955 [Flavisolibacter sp.]|nr:hypothetical protein [Flavisolibacter sp.]